MFFRSLITAVEGAAKSVSLEAYIETVVEVVLGAEPRVILVGHSIGGMTITGVAQQVPDAITRSNYSH